MDAGGDRPARWEPWVGRPDQPNGCRQRRHALQVFHARTSLPGAAERADDGRAYDPLWPQAEHAGGRIRGGRPGRRRQTFQAAAEPGEEHFREAIEGQRLLVQLGAGPLGLEEAAALGKVQGRPVAVEARVAEAGQLPDRWAGYEAVDTLLLVTSRPEVWRKLGDEPGRIEALDRWVRLGGKLVLSAGSRAEEVFAAGSPLARFSRGDCRA